MQRMDFKLRKEPTQALALLLAVALAARLPLWFGSFGATFDLESYHLVASHVLRGGFLYGDPVLSGRYPYPPLWLFFLLPCYGFSLLTGLPESMAYKIPGLLADLGIVWLLYKVLLRLKQPSPFHP